MITIVPIEPTERRHTNLMLISPNDFVRILHDAVRNVSLSNNNNQPQTCFSVTGAAFNARTHANNNNRISVRDRVETGLSRSVFRIYAVIIAFTSEGNRA